MDKEELVNLNMREVILNKWESKLSYPFNHKDLEELENIINYYEQENAQLKEQRQELRNWLEEQKQDRYYDNDAYRYTAYDNVLSKLNELEGGKNENTV